MILQKHINHFRFHWSLRSHELISRVLCIVSRTTPVLTRDGSPLPSYCPLRILFWEKKVRCVIVSSNLWDQLTLLIGRVAPLLSSDVVPGRRQHGSLLGPIKICSLIFALLSDLINSRTWFIKGRPVDCVLIRNDLHTNLPILSSLYYYPLNHPSCYFYNYATRSWRASWPKLAAVCSLYMAWSTCTGWALSSAIFDTLTLIISSDCPFNPVGSFQLRITYS